MKKTLIVAEVSAESCCSSIGQDFFSNKTSKRNFINLMDELLINNDTKIITCEKKAHTSIVRRAQSTESRIFVVNTSLKTDKSFHVQEIFHEKSLLKMMHTILVKFFSAHVFSRKRKTTLTVSGMDKPQVLNKLAKLTSLRLLAYNLYCEDLRPDTIDKHSIFF